MTGTMMTSDFAELERLAALPNLTELWLNSNAVARKQMYRPFLLRKLPTLASLDGELFLHALPMHLCLRVYMAVHDAQDGKFPSRSVRRQRCRLPATHDSLP